MLVTSCSAAIPPLPASLPAELAVESIDPKKYPEYPNHLAVHRETMRQYLVKRVHERQVVRDGGINAGADLAKARAELDDAKAVAASNEWWARYGAWVGAGVFAAIEVVAGLVAVAIIRTLQSN